MGNIFNVKKVQKEEPVDEYIDSTGLLSEAISKITVTKDCPKGLLKRLDDRGINAEVICKK